MGARKQVGIENESGDILAVCKNKADAGRYMFGVSDNPGKRVSTALAKDKGCIYDRKRGQKEGHPILILFRVHLTDHPLNVGPSDLGRQKLAHDQDGTPM